MNHLTRKLTKFSGYVSNLINFQGEMVTFFLHKGSTEKRKCYYILDRTFLIWNFIEESKI